MTQDRPKMTKDRLEHVGFVLDFVVFGGPRHPGVQTAPPEPLFSVQKSKNVEQKLRNLKPMALSTLKQFFGSHFASLLGPVYTKGMQLICKEIFLVGDMI